MKSRAFRLPPSAFILAVTLLAFAVRAYHLGYQSLWRDEADALRFATEPLPDLLSMFRGQAQNGPLFFLALRPWLAAAGHSEFALRFPSACLGTLAVPITYGLMSRLAGRRAAAATALLMAVAPYLVWYGQEAKMYAALTALVPLGLWLTLQAVQRGGKRYWVALYVVTSAGVYTHLLAALAIPVQIAWILLAPPAAGPSNEAAAEQGAAKARSVLLKRILFAAAYSAALVLPYLPVLIWALPMIAGAQYHSGFAFVPLPQIVETLTTFWSTSVLPLLGATRVPRLLAFAALLAGTTLWIMARGRGGWRLIAMLWAWLALPVVGIYLVSTSVPVFTERYVIWAMPAWLALQALGVVVLTHAWRPLGPAILAGALAFYAPTLGVQAYTPIKSDFRDAAQYVMAQRQPDERLMFQIPYNQYIFEYYTGPLSNTVEGPYTNSMNDIQADEWMSAATAGAQDVWLIASEVPLWDTRGFTEAWLNAHGSVTDRADFTLVTVIRYHLNEGAPP